MTREEIWISKLSLYVDHKDKMSTSTVIDGVKIGAWVRDVRKFIREGKYSKKRVVMLKEAGFDFGYSMHDDFAKSLFLFKKHRDHGDENNLGIIDGIDLTKWVLSLRTRYKSKLLSLSRIKDLDDIGFEWESSSAIRWNKQFELFVFYRNHIPERLKESLSRWIWTQRGMKHRGEINKEREESLTAAGMEWDGIEEGRRRSFNRLVLILQEYFKNKELFSQNNSDHLKYVHTHLSILRAERDSLSEEDLFRLQTIGMEWDSLYCSVFRGRVDEYKKHMLGENTIKNNRSITKWAYTQRREKKEGILQKERIKMLDAIGFDWEQKAEGFESNCQKALKYFSESGEKSSMTGPEKSKVKTWIKRVGSTLKRGTTKKKEMGILKKHNLDTILLEHLK